MTIRSLSALCALSTLVTLTACSTVHESRVTDDGREVAGLPRLPYCVAVEIAQGERLVAPAEPSSLGFVFDAKTFQQVMEHTLRDDCALATTVSAAESGDEQSADLLLRIVVGKTPAMEYEGTTSGNTAAVAMWLFTIFGGSFIEDCRYRVRMPMDCELCDAQTKETIYRFTADAGYVDTKYWDRVTVPGGLLWMFSCLPHCLVTDNVDVTSRSLSAKGTDQLAFDIAKRLKGMLEQSAASRLGRVDFASPTDAARMNASALRLECTVHTDDPLRELQVHLGPKTGRAVLHLHETQLSGTREGKGYVTRISSPLDVLEHPALTRGGDNFLHLRIKAGSVDVTRTLRLVLD